MVSIHTMTWISDLRRLQETDVALDIRRGSFSDAESRMGETEELIAARVREEELAAELRVARGGQKDIELEADALKSKIAPAETKLYSGSIKNPMDRAEVDEKCYPLLYPVLGKKHARSLVGTVWRIETVKDVRMLRPLLMV